MTPDFNRLPHQGIRDLAPYIPGKSEEELAQERGLTDILKLASNENPLGCSPLVHKALTGLTPKQMSTYHVSSQHPLRETLAQRLNLEKDNVMLSNGSDLIFHLLLMCFAVHQDKHILTHDYAFISYEIQAKTIGVTTRKTPLKANWQVDIDAMIQACTEKTALIFIANPNNPTGVSVPPSDLERLLAHIPQTTLLILDEAYHEYLPAYEQTDLNARLEKHKNLVITRTFSKAYGLAALRLGYACAHPEIVALLYRIQLPFAVNLAAMTAGQAALEDDAFLDKTLQTNQTGLGWMAHALTTLGLNFIPSVCNFITVHCPCDAQLIDQSLQAQGVIIRPLTP
ncbi:MAG: pyridoxal phosphate-dependent aminotransferase, partial [Legionellaceae bacterium]